MATIDLSVGPTETKYIKLKIKTQNNIVILGIFHKKWYYYFGFFWNNLTKIPVFTKKLFWVLVFGFMNLVSVDAKERSKDKEISKNNFKQKQECKWIQIKL